MSSSILNTTKKALGLSEEYAAFDPELVMHINATLASLHQLGVGPVAGFMIEDAAATWDSFIGADPRLNDVKQLVYLEVRMVFDPPGTSYLLTAFKERIDELKWRVNVAVEGNVPVIPSLSSIAVEGF